MKGKIMTEKEYHHNARYDTSWDWDFDEPHNTTTTYPTYGNTYSNGYGGYGNYSYGGYNTKKSSWWDNFSFTSTYESYKEKKARIKEIKKYIDDNLKTTYRIKATIGGETSVARKRSFYHIQVPNTDKYEKDIDNIEIKLGIYQGYPIYNRTENYLNQITKELVDLEYELRNLQQENGLDMNDAIHYATSHILSKFTTAETTKEKAKQILDKIKDIFINGDKSTTDVKEFYNLIERRLDKEDETILGHGGIDTSADRGRQVDRKKNKLQFQAPENQIVKEASLYRGRRINPQYIKGVDYKVLQDRHLETPQKTSLLILIDGSGSMDWDPYLDSINFTKDLMELGVFDIEVIHSTDRRLKNITRDVKKWNGGELISTGGSEGFELLTERYGKQITQDYVLIFTDMCVPSNAEDNLREFVKGKKHLVLNFGSTKSFQNLHTRQIKGIKDMKNVISTLFHNN